jgi:hypothetical protein
MRAVDIPAGTSLPAHLAATAKKTPRSGDPNWRGTTNNYQ